MMPMEEVKLELSNAEALILFEFVSRFSDKKSLEIKNPAEEKVLWQICCQLESILVEPFHRNYDELLAAARAEVLHED